MNCVINPGPSKAVIPEVPEDVQQLMQELLNLTQIEAMDSPAFSGSSFSGETTTASSENVTDQEQDHAPPAKRRRGRPPKARMQVVPEVINKEKKKSPKRRSTKVPKASRKRGSPKVELTEEDGTPKTTRKPGSPKIEEDDEEKPAKKRGRQVKSALSAMSKFEQSGGCLSQKACKKPTKRRSRDSPDPFDDNDAEYERVTKRMTEPRKRTIDYLHDATVFYMTRIPVPQENEAFKLVDLKVINEHLKEPDAGEVNHFPNESNIFKQC